MPETLSQAVAPAGRLRQPEAVSLRTGVALAFLSVFFSAPIASAQGVGFVGGATIDPEQIYAGSFFETPSIGGTIHIRPGVEGSWGDGVRIAAINVDIIHRGQIGGGWQFYTGGGPTVSILRLTTDNVPGTVTGNELTGGFTALFGFTHPNGFLVEVRYGSAAGGPSLKFGVGVQVGKRQ
jgi:hypothetical protein